MTPTFAGLRARTLAQYRATRVEELPFNYNGVVMSESEKMTTAAHREHTDRLLHIYHRQNRLVGYAGFVSPYVAMRNLSKAPAGVDFSHAIDFERQAEAYRFGLIQYLNELHTNEVTLAQDRYTGAGENGAPTGQRIAHEHGNRHRRRSARSRLHHLSIPSAGTDPPLASPSSHSSVPNRHPLKT